MRDKVGMKTFFRKLKNLLLKILIIVGYVLLIFIISMILSILQIFQGENIWYSIFITLLIVLCIGICMHFSSRYWFEHYVTFLSGYKSPNVYTERERYYAIDHHFFYQYQRKRKLLIISMIIQPPLPDIEKEYEERVLRMKRFKSLHSEIKECQLKTLNIVGECVYHICLERKQVSKELLLKIKEWLKSQHIAVASYLGHENAEGRFFLEYLTPNIRRCVYIDKQGKIERYNQDEDDYYELSIVETGEDLIFYDESSSIGTYMNNMRTIIICGTDYAEELFTSENIISKEAFEKAWNTSN